MLLHTGADLGFSEGGAKTSSGSLKQGVWGLHHPEAIGCWVFEVPKSKISSTFDGFLKDGDKCMYLIILSLLCSLLSIIPYPKIIPIILNLFPSHHHILYLYYSLKF